MQSDDDNSLTDLVHNTAYSLPPRGVQEEDESAHLIHSLGLGPTPVLKSCFRNASPMSDRKSMTCRIREPLVLYDPSKVKASIRRYELLQ